MSNRRPAPDVLETLTQYGSATAQNAGVVVRGYVPESSDYSGPALQSLGQDQDRVVVGYALTARVMPLHEPARLVDWDEHYDALARTDGPTIVVLEDADDPFGRAACMGDVMAHRYRALGASGAIVGGAVRDVAGIRRMSGFGLWATGRVPGHGPFHVVDINCDVTVAGLMISPGDLLVADADGVTRIPLEEAEAIARGCVEVCQKEDGYHHFFSKPDFSLEDHEEFKRHVAEEEKIKP